MDPRLPALGYLTPAFNESPLLPSPPRAIPPLSHAPVQLNLHGTVTTFADSPVNQHATIGSVAPV